MDKQVLKQVLLDNAQLVEKDRCRALLGMVIVLTNELLLHKFVQPTIYSEVYQIVHAKAKNLRNGVICEA